MPSGRGGAKAGSRWPRPLRLSEGGVGFAWQRAAGPAKYELGLAGAQFRFCGRIADDAVLLWQSLGQPDLKGTAWKRLSPTGDRASADYRQALSLHPSPRRMRLATRL